MREFHTVWFFNDVIIIGEFSLCYRDETPIALGKRKTWWNYRELNRETSFLQFVYFSLLYSLCVFLRQKKTVRVYNETGRCRCTRLRMTLWNPNSEASVYEGIFPNYKFICLSLFFYCLLFCDCLGFARYINFYFTKKKKKKNGRRFQI